MSRCTRVRASRAALWLVVLGLPLAGCAAGPIGADASTDGPAEIDSAAIQDQAASARQFRPRFATDGLVTNEFAHQNPDSPLARLSRDWEMTSGSLFARSGVASTGRPDTAGPGPTSRRGTNSAVFRLRTVRSDFADTAIDFEFRLAEFVATRSTPARNWDGLHVWLGYRSPDDLHYASIARRDGAVVIGRKLVVAGVADYRQLAVERRAPVALGQWQRFHGEIRRRGGAVDIQISVNGERFFARDQASARLPRPGKIGLRSDNLLFQFRGFRAAPLT